MALTVALGLVVAGLVMAIYNESQADAQRLKNVAVQAHILAASVAAPLAFDDLATARDYVGALRADREVEAAGVYDQRGALAAGWVRGGARLPTANRIGPPVRVGDGLVVTEPVIQGATALGSIYLRTIQDAWPRRAMRYGGIGILILMAALLVAGLGASNASLQEAQRKVRLEMAERAKAEAALRESQRLETEAQLEVAHERGRQAVRQSEAQLEFALRAGDLGSWTQDFRTGVFSSSPLFRAHYGFEPDDLPASAAEFLARTHPDDRREQLKRVEAAIAERGVLETEFRSVSPDGATRWILIRGRADYDETGAPVRMAGISMDVSARRAADERQRLLLDELNHRVKNTLAAVQSIALQTGRAADTARSFESAFIARINALARVHDLLTRVAWEGASLADVVAQTLAPYQARRAGARATVFGPDVRLGPNAAVTLAMAFHELATNAAKYGALSTDDGVVEVDWRIGEGGETGTVEISWIESGGPLVVPPTRRGFGLQFLERALAREFDGSVNLRFTSTGLNCRMRLPLSAKLRLAA
jgi:PAS domain S-box-containing protein